MFPGTAPTRYARRGHIPSGVSIPARSLQTPGGQLRPLGELQEATARLPYTRPMTVYCGGGISATVDLFALSLVGRDDARLYDGSLTEWTRDETLPVEVG